MRAIGSTIILKLKKMTFFYFKLFIFIGTHTFLLYKLIFNSSLSWKSPIYKININLLKPFSYQEIENALFQMQSDKCPSLDGVSVLFFHKFWTVIKGNIIALLICFQSFLVVVPKNKFNFEKYVILGTIMKETFFYGEEQSFQPSYL